MIHNIIPDLLDKAYPVEELHQLTNNPHKGDLEATKAVFLEFGQHTPILVHSGSMQIIAGNTRFRAAKELGWTHVAVTWVDEDEARAVARALSDNRLAELGQDDPAILAEILPSIIEVYPDVFDVMGWDEWEIAALEESSYTQSSDTGYSPPPAVRRDPVVADRETNSAGDERLVAPVGSDQSELVRRGAGETDPKRATVIQYTLVFDDAEQQRRWYQFVTWLRGDPELSDYETTAAKLIAFLEPRADF